VTGSTLTEIITDIANVALLLSFIVALIFGIEQVRAAARDRRERLTIEALNNFQTREFAELMHHINSHELPKTRDELNARPAGEQVLFIQFAQQMESLGILVAERIVNVDLVDKTLGSFVTSAWEKYRPVFLDVRETTHDPFLAEYFQWLAELIDRRMKETPRQPFYEKGKPYSR